MSFVNFFMNDGTKFCFVCANGATIRGGLSTRYVGEIDHETIS